MNRGEFVRLHKSASKVNPKATMDLDSVYANSDMPWCEYTAHLKIIAEGEE